MIWGLQRALVHYRQRQQWRRGVIIRTARRGAAGLVL